MQCEVCGESFNYPPSKTLIEGAELLVCHDCASLGKEALTPLRAPASTMTRRPPLRSPTSRPPPSRPARLEEETALVSGYGLKVKETREKLGWSQEELGLKIMEKASLIGKIETERIVPSEEVVRKLARTLGLSLTEGVVQPIQVNPKPLPSKELTLSDIAVMKRRERDDASVGSSR